MGVELMRSTSSGWPKSSIEQGTGLVAGLLDDKDTVLESTISGLETPHHTISQPQTTPLMMPGRQDAFSVSIPTSPPPPQSISSYSRFIHDHTKRQMQAFGALSPTNSGSSSRSSVGTSMTNGAAPTM
ncbi:hypothetical protein TrVGV298_011747 [Trichoderma virens]|nr:hypothetical protein TrVGV298_011747 [Trichoderma virens]